MEFATPVEAMVKGVMLGGLHALAAFGTFLRGAEAEIVTLQLSNRGYVLEQGHLVQEGDAGELLEDDNVKSAYLGI